uniref:Uncharacterized protein n=1 Tax=Tetranychus urticae TaxID=32264 RepID=T1K1Y0_TETUR
MIDTDGIYKYHQVMVTQAIYGCRNSSLVFSDCPSPNLSRCQPNC